MAKDSPTRPDSVPAKAVWNSEENEWELGEKTADGKETGAWIWWGPDGSLVSKATYDAQGKLHGRFERWHPNGEIAQWSDWIHGKTHGMQVWTLATSGESDKSSVFPPNVGDDVMRMDMPYDMGRPQLYHFTFYKREGLQDGVPCDEEGRSIDLGRHLHRVAPETTLHLLTSGFFTAQGNWVEKPEDESVRWIFHGSSGHDWKVRRILGTRTDYVVSSQEMSRAFTLSADFYLTSLKEKRPASVPQKAVWKIEDKAWELGDLKNKHPVGPWRIWDEEGRLRKQMNYTRYGALHGDVEHFHPDGTPAFRATYFKGDQVGKAAYTRCESNRNEEFVPAADNVWRCEVEVRDGREVREYFLRKGQRCNRFGVPVADVFKDSLFLENPPATFLKSGFDAALAALVGVRVDDSEDVFEPNFAGWADFWGQEMHPDLQAFLKIVLRNQTPVLSTFNFEDRSNLFFLTEVSDNAMELLISGAQQRLGTPFVEVFSGAVTLGSAESAVYRVTSCHRTSAPRVLVFDRDIDQSSKVFTKGLGQFAYLITSADAYFSLDALSHEAMEHVWAQVDGAWTPWGPWLEQAPESRSRYEVEDDSIALEKASRWIVELLQGFRPLEQIARDVNLNDWPVFDATNWAQTRERAKADVPFGLHALWRLFFCKKDFELGELITVCADSPARILRDAAAVLHEIQWGEERLGKIEDIYELREEFWQLGVLPGSVKETLDAAEQILVFRKLLPQIYRSRDPQLFWDVAMTAHLASDEQREQALRSIANLAYLDTALMPVVRLAAQRLGDDVSDVRQRVRTALAKETNPLTVEAGRAQNIWALRVAGEDDSIEVKVLEPWLRYDDEDIRTAAIEAMQKRLPDFEIPKFWGDEVRALIDQGAASASAVAAYVEQMLEDWVPFAAETPTPEILDTMMASLAQFNDKSAWLVAASKCLNHPEDVIIQAGLRVPPPHDTGLLNIMAKHEETQTAHARKVARQWLESYPDQAAANEARDL